MIIEQTPDYKLTEDVPPKKVNLRLVVEVCLLIILGVVFIYYYLSFLGLLPTISNMEFSIKPVKADGRGEIMITNQGFVPATILVVKGTSVTWANTNKNIHTLTPDQNTAANLVGFESEEILHPSDTFTYTFEQEGKYVFYDNYGQSKYKGIIIVE